MTSASPRRYLAIGGMSGLAGGLLGVGGGFVMVPLQILWAGVPSRRASGNSLAAIVPIAVVGALIYYFGSSGSPQLDLQVAVWVMAGASVGSFVGSELALSAPDRVLRWLLVILLLLGSGRELYDAALGGGGVQGGAPTHFTLLGYALITLAGFVIGSLSGLTGVGGGILLVPALVVGFGVGQRVAQGTSLVAILPTAAIAAAIHWRHGDLHTREAIPLAVGGVSASLVGAALALWLPQRVLAGLFGVLLLVMAARMWRSSAPETAAGSS